MPESSAHAGKFVRHYRQILIWPLQLMPLKEGTQIQKHWEPLEQDRQDNPWHEVLDEFIGDPTQFKERHYTEFVTFLPYVQRFIYGEGLTAGKTPGFGASPMRVFRRDDVTQVRMTVREGAAPVIASVAHIDLYFFFDIDVTLLVTELYANDLPLATVQELLYRSGRAYPAGWDDDGQGVHCMYRTEFLAADGQVLAVSDFHKREKYLTYVCQHRAPCIAAHWAFLLKPLVLHHSEEKGIIRYRQLEYYRMPMMAYLALDDPRALTRNDLIRLGMVTAAGEGEALPYSDRHLADFEDRYCYDRFWSEAPEGPRTRFMCTGHALVMVGEARNRVFTDKETGALAQFRHQYFLLFMIAHFQRAALLMFSDRLIDALNWLEVLNAESVKRFKRSIRQIFEIFLRFMHRYWFHEVSGQAQSKALFRLCTQHLETDNLFAEVKDDIENMNDYLDSDSLRRQANTVVRLTVVTTFGLIGTISTGYFGMNIFSFGDIPPLEQVIYAVLMLVGIAWLTGFTLIKSKRLADFLDALSDERLTVPQKFAAFFEVWRRKPRPARQ